MLRADRDGVCQLTLNRPDKPNALNVDLFKALKAHVADLEVATVGVVGRCFSAGHDLGDIAAGEKLPRPNYQSYVIPRLADLPSPASALCKAIATPAPWSLPWPATSFLWRNPLNSATPTPNGP